MKALGSLMIGGGAAAFTAFLIIAAQHAVRPSTTTGEWLGRLVLGCAVLTFTGLSLTKGDRQQ